MSFSTSEWFMTDSAGEQAPLLCTTVLYGNGNTRLSKPLYHSLDQDGFPLNMRGEFSFSEQGVASPFNDTVCKNADYQSDFCDVDTCWCKAEFGHTTSVLMCYHQTTFR